MKMDNDSTTPHSCEYRYNQSRSNLEEAIQLVLEANHFLAEEQLQEQNIIRESIVYKVV